MRWLQLLCVSALICAVLASAGVGSADEGSEEPVFSGPQPGETLPPFKMRGVYGDAAGQEIDLVSQADGKPIVLVFVHERTRPTVGVTRALMNYARQRRQDQSLRKGQELTLGVVWLTSDATDTEKWLKLVERLLGKDVPVGVSLDGAEGPGAYGLNRNVALTVLVGKEGRVTSNFALVQPSLQADLPKVLEAIVETSGGKVPELPALIGEMRPAARPAAGLPDEAAGMLRRLIRKDADDEQVARAARELEAYFEKHKEAGPQVGQIARRIIDAGKLETYGTPKAREHLQTWAEKYAPADRQSPDRETPERQTRTKQRQTRTEQ